MTPRQMARRLAQVTCLCTALAWTANAARATTLVTDDFTYADGPLVGNGGWANHNGTADTLLVVGGQALVNNATGSEDANLPLGATIGPGQTFYAGFDVSNSGAAATAYFAHFKDMANGFTSRVYVTPPLGGGDYTLGFSQTSTMESTWATGFTFGSTQRVVISYNLDNNQSRMWVNPVDENSTNLVSNNGIAASILQFALRQSGGGSMVLVDNLCVATTFTEAATCIAQDPTGACILLDTTCIITTQTDCASQGGAYQGDASFCVPQGACCLPGGGCSVLGQDECASVFGGAFRGDATLCTTPGICDCQTIQHVKDFALLGEGVALCEATVVETVNQGGQVAGDRSFTVQDQSGANVGPGGTERGIRIVGDQAVIGATFDALTEGTRVEVFGTTEDFGGTLYIRVGAPASIVNLGAGGVFNVAPITVADLLPGATFSEELESVRVSLQCIGFVAGGTGNFTPNTTFIGTDGVDQFPFRINDDDFAAMPAVGTPIPQMAVDVVGVYSEFVSPQLYINEADDLTAATCGGQLGACCESNGNCYQTIQAICESEAIGDSFGGIGVSCTPSPCVTATGACCVGETCTAGQTQTDCNGMGGFYLGDDTDCTFGCNDPTTVRINEIRIDQGGTDTDEYFELKGLPGTPLDSLTYVVIGDGASVDASGVIDTSISLAGQSIQADGLFLVAMTPTLPNFPGATVDLAVAFAFENSDNVTHMLVQDYVGANGDDLDVDDDCVLDPNPPWGVEVDRIALVEAENPPVGTGNECHYGPPRVGPDGAFVPGHVYRCPLDPGGPWFVGGFAVGTNDTPGAENDCLVVPGACCFEGGGGGCPSCPGDFDETGGSMGQVDLADVPGFADALLNTGDTCADINGDFVVNGLDIVDMIALVLGQTQCPATGCQFLTMDDCTTAGGTFIGEGVPCTPDPCGPTGACCAGEPSFACDDVTAAQCAANFPERMYLGDGTTCANDCVLEATEVFPCAAGIDCTATQWCIYVVVETNLTGAYCDAVLFPFSSISIPCDGSCVPDVIETFRWSGVGPLGEDCVFTAMLDPTFHPTLACSNFANGQAFNLAP